MYFLKRILSFIPLLLIISFFSFLLLKMMPGGPFDGDRQLSPQIKHNLEAKFYLDKPFLVQYGYYLRDLMHGDMRPSMVYRNHSVNDIIADGFPVSMTLGICAFCFALGTGIPLGFFTAVNKGAWGDYAGSFLALLVICIPGLVIGPILIMLFAVKTHLFPVALWGSPSHLILPSLTLGLYFSGRVARLMREGMMTTLHSEFITTARSKGLSETAILLKHAFRIAVLPVLSYSGPLLADLLTGSFIVENLFQIPGIGIFMVNSVQNKDYTMLGGLVLLYAFLLLVLNLVVDLAYSQLDRRVKYE